MVLGWAFGELAGLALEAEVQGNLVSILVMMLLICRKKLLMALRSGRTTVRTFHHLSMISHILGKVVASSLVMPVVDILGMVVESGIRLIRAGCFVEVVVIVLENEAVDLG